MTLPDARIALKKFFGYDNFRPMQADIVQNVYNGKDTVVLMPTGGGKSICFQIPAITLDGVCIVVSPLISLMKDQVESLRSNGIPCAFYNSTLTSSEQREIEEDLDQGRIKLLYVSPEKLMTRDFYRLLQMTEISLFAIDEAHCISAWGHDFRPEYTKMNFLKKSFPKVPIMALTATADKTTRKDIINNMGMINPDVFISSFDRPNLSLEVRPGQKKLQQILKFIETRKKQSGIIYCLSRKNTEAVAEKLRAKGLKARAYHAGLPASIRSEVQEDFINDVTPIVCATVAFGMGIDKSNVRYVIHHNLPKNIESFYQEIGRAGRDGTNADTMLFWSYADMKILTDILSDNESTQKELKLAKLERMRQYAESMQCRRKVLLNYFGENMEKDCGNCDVCQNPPEYIDGTVIAQKALSAISRMKENVGIVMLINVLRGSTNREVFMHGYDKVKTYGAGRDFSYLDWQNYIGQLLNLGLLEIAYDDNNTLKITAQAKEVLFDGKKIELVKPIDIKQRQEAAKVKANAKPKRERLRDELFEILRKLRKQLAQVRGVPPYLIFNDATLEEMSAARPMTDTDMMKINGVGERKMHLYGDKFKEAILEYVVAKEEAGEKITGSTHMISLNMYQKGAKVDEIAIKRKLNPVTILGHLAKAYELGEEVDISPFAAQHEIDHILTAIPHLEEPHKMKDIFDYFEEKIPYDKIKFAMAHYYREATVEE